MNCELIYNDILSKIDNNSNTHPNLMGLWKNYLEIKKKNFMNACSQCESMITRLDSINDCQLSSILVLILLCLEENNIDNQ